MEQALQALQALYSPSDSATKKQADDWLTKFQQTPAAWQVADSILSRQDLPIQFRFFAAQTMRTKVQFDFYELPTEAYVNLRDSLLNYIGNFSRSPELAPIHTQLAIAVADLAIQMDSAWPNAVQSLFERFGRNPDSYATLLEMLRMLPEENMNYKLMTDSHKRQSSRDRLQQATPQVVQFLLTLQCPSAHAKKKVLECFLSWIKFTNLQAGEIAQNPLLPECFKYITEGGDLAEISTDIVVEVLRMSSLDLKFFQPVIQVILSLLPPLRSKFEALLSRGVENALDADPDGILQVCRIFVEVGECLIPLIMEQIANQEVLLILRVILHCTDLPRQEISTIPFDFWHRLANEVCRHPETDAKIDQFQGIYRDLLIVAIRRCTISPTEDPFQMDDDLVYYRQQLKKLTHDALRILTPNTALEHVLKSLQDGQRQGIVVQEAHFFCLAVVGEGAEVRNESVLWQLIQSLPPLISETVDETKPEGVILHFTKKTAIELLGELCQWIKTRPEFLRSALEMISALLLHQVAPGSPNHVLERVKQVQQSAAMAFKNICYAGTVQLADLTPQLTQLYVSTMSLSIRMHLYIVDGVGNVVAQLKQDDAFRSGLEQLVMPLVTGIQSEREKPQVLSEILDRLTTIIRQIQVQSGTSKAITVGSLITNGFWPVTRQCLEWHPTDSKVVEKSCRLLKHSMRCVPDLFKPLVPAVAATLVPAFQAHQHSSYLYSAEILANTYAVDPEVIPVLTTLFHQLSGHGLQVLLAGRGHLENLTELVEDFYGMFDRYMRYVPMIVLEAPTLQPTMEFWFEVIFVQQKDAIEAVIAFIEAVFSGVAEAAKGAQRFSDEKKLRMGQLLRPHALSVGPGLVLAIFRLISQVPTRYVQEVLPAVLDTLRAAFPQEFPVWIGEGLRQLPPCVASPAEQNKLGEQLVRGDDAMVYDAVSDLCYRCEQVALRNRGTAEGGETERRGKR